MLPSEPTIASDSLHPDERSWPVWKWALTFVIVFGLHVGFFYALNQPAAPARPHNRAPLALRFQSELDSLQQMEDPTLFALPHPRGFAGMIWTPPSRSTNTPFRWTEAPRLLPLPVTQLGNTFLQIADTNQPTFRDLANIPTPSPTVLPPIDPPPQRTISQLRASGALVNRPFTSATVLPLVPPTENFTNTVVQVLVDQRGQVLSAKLLNAGSVSLDQTALNISRNLWFARSKTSADLTVGELIFEWAAKPGANAPNDSR